MAKNKVNLRIRNSVIIVSGANAADGDAVLKQAVENFDIADKTPMQCHDFVRSLKNLFKK